MAVVFITRSNLVIWFSGFIFFVKCIFGQMDITTVKIETTTEENLSYVPPVYPNEIEFHLFTSKYYTDQYVLINPNKTETYNHLFGKMYFLMHGWKEFPENTSWFYPITEILLKKFPHASVIHMDWRKQSNLFYNVSLYTIPKVSEFMGDFIAKIYVSNNKPKEIVLMGNSLGGQLISYVAKRFKNVTGKKVSRIISLDPAGFIFNTSTPDKRLIKDDAENVVVVHTDQIFGIGNVRIGHIDIIINGGILQPGCPPIEPYNFTVRIPGPDEPIWCGHARVNYYLLEALKAPEHFLARRCRDYDSYKQRKCDNVQISLGDLETTRRGLFFLDTTGEPPYYKRRIDSLPK